MIQLHLNKIFQMIYIIYQKFFGMLVVKDYFKIHYKKNDLIMLNKYQLGFNFNHYDVLQNGQWHFLNFILYNNINNMIKIKY